MKVLIIDSYLIETIVKKVFKSKLVRDYDVEVITKGKVNQTDCTYLFVTAGNFAKKVKDVIRSFIKEDKIVFYVDYELTISKIYFSSYFSLNKFNFSIHFVFLFNKNMSKTNKINPIPTNH